MGINFLLCGKLIDLVMGISYNINAGLALDADLALFAVDADVSVKMRSCSDLQEAQDAKLLIATFEVKRRVAHTCA